MNSLDTTISEQEDCKNESTKAISQKKMELSPSQKARIELNRQKAKLIRMEKMNKRKLSSIPNKTEEQQKKVIRVNNTKLVDTGSGFFIEEIDQEQNEEKKQPEIIREPAPLPLEDQPFCEDCLEPFDSSYLQKYFSLFVCDQCRDSEDKHCLITKTDAKNNYLLSDVDFDIREPALKFIVRKNPHNDRWGDMKLYLKLQIENRALEVWKTEEALEEAMQNRLDKRENLKKKKFQNKMKELRMNVRSSLYTRAVKSHVHEYGEEIYLPDEDEYSKTCSSCGHSYTYDKM